jgi:Protein kinase domain
MKHPNSETLQAFGLGKVSGPAADTIAAHLTTCVDCRRAVASLSADSFIDRIQAADVEATLGAVPPELADHPDYHVVCELGRGGMGVVYLARNTIMDRDEVLKVAHRALLEKPGASDRFLQEIRSAAQLMHVNVVRAYSVLRLGDLLVFAMEYVPGDDLAVIIRKEGALPVAHACNYAAQVALGLQHAHEKGMVHRDIKPSNLILSKDGKNSVVKILDFGLAKMTSEVGFARDLTGSNKMMGTPDYISPEQILDAGKADIRADIYSLGCTLYYLLAGSPPFAGGSLYEVLHAHNTASARPLNLVRPEVPSELAAVVAKMLAKEPRKRYQTPGEVAKELQPFTKAEAVPTPAAAMPMAHPAPAPPKARPMTRGPVDARELSRVLHARGPARFELAAKTMLESPPNRTRSPKPAARAAGTDRRVLWIGLGLIATLGVGLLGLLLDASGIFRVATPDGTIVVENVPSDADVLVDGASIAVSRNGETVTANAVREGLHRLKVMKGNVELLSSDVTVKLGDVPVRLRMEPRFAAAKANLSKEADKPTPQASAEMASSAGSVVMPRRVLFISPENYFFLNRTQFFQEDNGQGAFENTLIRRICAGAPLDISPGQVYVLSDSDILQTATSPQKSVVEAAIKDFCEGSRAQDRIVLLWSGHAAEIDGKTYLIPIEGDKDAKETCISLAWVYQQLGKSKARQKVLIFDAFRYPPARGLELPATGKMTESVDKELDDPPPGIQVWTACVKGQQSIEFESGSVFQLALREALKELSVTRVKPADSLPMQPLVVTVNQIMKLKLARESVAPMKFGPDLVQTSRLSGKELPGANYLPTEPLPRRVVFTDPDKGVNQIKGLEEILREIKEFQPMKQSQVAQLLAMRTSELRMMSKEKLAEYPDEGFNPFAGKTDKASLATAKKKYPLRVAAFEAASKIRATMDLRMKEYISNPGGGAFDQNRKKQFLSEQMEPALAILDLEEMLSDMKKLDRDRENEPNKRWLAHFDMAQARLMSRLIYMNEYDNLIARIRADSLPRLDERIHLGWRVSASDRVQIREVKVQTMARDVAKLWTRMEKEYPMTPWAIIAKREKNMAMGMTWLPTRE